MMFELTDSEGDKLRVSGALGYGDRERLIVGCDDTDTGETVGVYVLRNDVIRLYDWLGSWLGEDPTPEQPEAPLRMHRPKASVPAPLTAADVRAIAAEVVAEALAQRDLSDLAGARPCTIPDCDKFPDVAQHFEHDPEPRDVGHPDGECTCHDAEGNSIRPVTLAQALADPTPAGLDALWGRSGPCDANPSAQLFTGICHACGYVWGAHRAKAPEQKTVIVPECGLCKAPWSDGHGQPGDPCTGAPKQLVGCECGHGWGAHSKGGCGSVSRPLGGALHPCTCTRRPPSAPAGCECGHRTALHDSRGCPGRQVGMVHKPCPCTVTR